MTKTIGWIRLDRKLLDHWVWNDRPFAKGQAWVDLVLTANHREQKVLFNGQSLTIERGSTLTSIRKLSERWGWSQGKARRFLDVLKADGMLTEERSGNGTVLTLVNYGAYQDIPSPGGAQTERQTERQQNAGGEPREQKQSTDGAAAEHGRKTDGKPAETNNNIITIINNETKKNSGCAASAPAGLDGRPSHREEHGDAAPSPAGEEGQEPLTEAELIALLRK